MLALMAAQLKEQIKASGSDKAPIWVDLGGGTGKHTIPLSNAGLH
jgi:tRNA G46 methylase TrmB